MVTEVHGPALLVSTNAGGAGLFELIGVLVASLIMFYIRRRMILIEKRTNIQPQ